MTWALVLEALTAIGTVAMAVTTFLVIRQSKQQHQDAFRPICVLVPDDGIDVFARPPGAKQSIPGPLRIPVFLNERFNQADFQFTPDLGWELWLIYEDVFGNVFHTRHSKNPQEPWGATGRGSLSS